MEGDEAEVSHATNLHPPSTAQAIAVISDSVIDIFDSGGGMGDFQDINGVGTVDRAMANLEENDALAMGCASVAEVTPRPTIPARLWTFLMPLMASMALAALGSSCCWRWHNPCIG